jgi:hypothetical protein
MITLNGTFSLDEIDPRMGKAGAQAVGVQAHRDRQGRIFARREIVDKIRMEQRGALKILQQALSDPGTATKAACARSMESPVPPPVP